MSAVRTWLGYGVLRNQNKYHEDLEKYRGNEACYFVLKNSSFYSWYHDAQSRQLAILGDMGSGKTVIVSHLIEWLIEENQHQVPQPKVVWFYCLDGVTDGVAQILAAFTLSLLNQLQGLQKPFYEWYKKEQSNGLDPAVSHRKMEEYLQDTLATLDRPIFIVLDGLDECRRESRIAVIKTLRNLCLKTSRLKLIVSSRPEADVIEHIGEMSKIELNTNLCRDKLIVHSLIESILGPNVPEGVKTLIEEKIPGLAQGSAIWSRMVIELVNVRKFHKVTMVRRFLKSIPLPPKLLDLYASLFSRYTLEDPENAEVATAALKILAVSHRPLSLLELAWAVTMGVDRVDTLHDLSDLVDPQRILNLIQPFITGFDLNDMENCRVQLVHQSVKEFVVASNGSNSGGSTVGNLNTFMFNICIRYLLLEEVSSNKLFSEELEAISELPQGSDLFDEAKESTEYDVHCTWEVWEEDMIRFDPNERGLGKFFVYASCYWLKHFEFIEAEDIPPLADIECLCQANSIRLNNWIQQNCRPDCTILPRFVFDSRLYDPLGIVSLYGSKEMLHYLLETSKFSKDYYLEDSVMSAADQILQWGELSRLRTLFFNESIGAQLHCLGFFRLVLERWKSSLANRQGWGDVFSLIDELHDELVEQEWGNEILCVAARLGCLPFIQRLIAHARENETLSCELLRECRLKWHTRDYQESSHQSIGEAVLGNNIDVVRLLLGVNGIEKHLKYRTSRGENVFHLASRFCNPKMLDLLARDFREGISQKDSQGDTALMRIILNVSTSHNRYESAKILLSLDTSSRHSDTENEFEKYFQVALQNKDLDMCCLLVHMGNICHDRSPREPHDCQTDSMDYFVGDFSLKNRLLELFLVEGIISNDFIKSNPCNSDTIRKLAEETFARRFPNS